MLIDTLNRASQYPFGPVWANVVTDLRALAERGAELAEGVYPLGNGAAVATVSVYTSKPEAEGRYETHERMTDIQLVLEGEEDINVVDREGLTPATAYDGEKDITFYQEKPHAAARVRLTPGRFMFVLPHDGHMPGLAVGSPSRVRKLVVKLPVASLILV